MSCRKLQLVYDFCSIKSTIELVKSNVSQACICCKIKLSTSSLIYTSSMSTLIVPELNGSSESDLDSLTLLTDVQGKLQFVTEIINRYSFPASVRTKLLNQLSLIQHKRSNPSLNLAIIGEFSSGKSTFINALLRDDLLKTSALVATAIATRLKHGDLLQVEAEFTGNNATVIKTDPEAQNIRIPWLPDLDGLDNRTFIHQITANDAISQNIAKVTISHPASFLYQDITIIDTPGTNATNPLHGTITRQTVEEEADAAIIIIPATTPLSQSLSTFLEEALRPYLHRCIFVVTRMDQIRASEQEILLEDVRSRLKQQLNIEPQLYPCSAQVVLDALNGEAILPQHQHWKDSFAQLEASILKRLQHERLSSISESLLRLLNRLFTQLESQLRSQQKNYERRQAAIEKEEVPDFQVFLERQKSVCQTEINQSQSDCLRKCRETIEQHQEALQREAQQLIMNAQNESVLMSAVETSIPQLLATHQETLQQEIQLHLNGFKETGLKLGKRFDQQFAEIYQRLQTLGGAIAVPTTDIKTTIQFPNSILTSVLASQRSMNQQGESLAIGGVAAGAVLGTAIFPIVGTVIGGVLGGLFSTQAFSPSLSTRKQTLWNQLLSSLNEHFTHLKGEAQSETEAYARRIIIALDQKITTYVAQYEQTILTLKQNQQTQLNKLHKLSKDVQSDLQRIEQHRNRLQNQQQRLSNHHVSN
jgi:GTPase Era involved in 16S rRNA processing/gas vesicle protein